MNTTSTSTGERITTSVCESRIRKAKAQKLRDMIDEHGFVFCEDCKQSGGVRLDCSHEIGVKEAKESGRTELCWDVDNIKIRCRYCHQVKDKLNIQKG